MLSRRRDHPLLRVAAYRTPALLKPVFRAGGLLYREPAILVDMPFKNTLIPLHKRVIVIVIVPYPLLRLGRPAGGLIVIQRLYRNVVAFIDGVGLRHEFRASVEVGIADIALLIIPCQVNKVPVFPQLDHAPRVVAACRSGHGESLYAGAVEQVLQCRGITGAETLARYQHGIGTLIIFFDVIGDVLRQRVVQIFFLIVIAPVLWRIRQELIRRVQENGLGLLH